jgi:hypothetical protein
MFLEKKNEFPIASFGLYTGGFVAQWIQPLKKDFQNTSSVDSLQEAQTN